MLEFTGEKMSKSLGNVVTLRDALEEWGRETLLLFFLTGHWRKPLDFSEETMAQAKAQVDDVPEREHPRRRSRAAMARPGTSSSRRSKTTSTRPTRSR